MRTESNMNDRILMMNAWIMTTACKQQMKIKKFSDLKNDEFAYRLAVSATTDWPFLAASESILTGKVLWHSKYISQHIVSARNIVNHPTGNLGSETNRVSL